VVAKNDGAIEAIEIKGNDQKIAANSMT